MSSVIIKGLRVPNVKKPFGTSHLDANHIPRSGLPQVETKMPQPSSAEIAHILDELNMSPQEFMQAAAEPDGMERLLARVTKPDIIPTLDDSKEAMDQMLAQIQQAKTIALREKSLSPFRYSPPPRAEFSFALEAKRQECEHQQALERPQMVQTHIGTRPHVSRLPLDELSRVNLRNMDVRKVHTGQYLLCRIVSLPVRVFAVQFGVEDPRGSVTLVSLYGYPGTLGASMRTLDALFPLGYVLAIKEPYMKEMASGGGAHIRVDCASDLLFIHTDHPSLEGVQWKTRSPASPLAVITSPDAWKELGNQYFKDALYFPAAVTYSRGLQHHPTAHLLRLNRAMAYLRLGYFGAALADCQQIMDLPTSTGNVHLKALFRAAQAKYGLGWWNDALSTFKDVARLYPSEAKVCNGWIEKCIQRKREAESGQYRWVTMFEEAQIPGKRLDVAEYVGAIEVTSSPPCGGGRGVIATRDIEPGELLVVSKAFAVCYPEDLPKDTKYLAINFLNDRVQKDCSAVLDHKIIEQLVSDPGRSSALYDLYAGPEEASPPPTYSIPDRTAVPIEHLPHSGVNVDASRIQGITTYNAFKPTTLKRRAVALVQRNSKEKDDGPSALFLLPSLFNHSCAPNARWYCFGDIMVIRALRAIQKGEEVYLAYGGQGLTYLTRNQDIGLTKFLGTCQCNLCSADREDGLVHCKQRESIFGNIYSCDTIDGVKKGIKALKKTYKRNPNGEGMWAATNHLAELHMNNGDTAGYIRETIQAMGYAGITVRDKSIRGSQRVTDGLPIGLCENAAEPNAFSRVCEVIVDACMALSDTFYEEFSDTARGKSWEDAAAWLHDICFGGGSELFKARYPVSVRDAPTPTNTSRPGLARHVKILEMSAGSLSGLMSKAASKDNVDISSGSLPEDISFELPPESPTKRPAIVSSSPRVPSSNSRNVFSRLPSESMNVPSTMDNSTATGSKLPSFLVDPDETNLSMLDTPIREKRTFDDITAGGRRGRSSLGGAPRGQMTLREQEKVIDTIKKENFSLKMKVHLLEERLGQLAPEHMEAAVKNNIRLKIEVHSRGAEIKKLKKRISEMEKDAAENKSGSRTEQDSSLVVQLEEELGKKDDEILGLKRQLRESHQSSFSSSSSQPALIHLQEHIEELQKRNAELEAQNERKDHQLDEKEEEIDDLYAQVQQRGGDADRGDVSRRARDLEHRNRELERELDKVDRDRQAAEEDIDILKENCALLQAQLEESEARRRADAEERSFSRAEILEEKQDKEALEQSANEYRDRLAAANIELEERENELDQKNAQCEALIRELEILQSSNDELKDRIEMTIERMNQINAEKDLEIQAREDEIRDLNIEVSEYDKRVAQLEDDLEAERTYRARIDEEFAEREEEYGRRERIMSNKLQDKSNDIATLRDHYENARQQVLNHASVLEDEKALRLQLEDELGRARADLDEAAAQWEERLRDSEDQWARREDRLNKELDDRDRKYRRDLAEMLEDKNKKEVAAAALQERLAQREEDIATLQAKLNDLEKESLKLGESHTTDRFALELELERLRRDLARAKEDAERFQKNADERDGRSRERENAIDKLHAENRDLASQLAAQTQARLNLSEKLDSVQSDIKVKETELTDARSRYNELEKQAMKERRLQQSQESEHRDQLTERNTLLLTIYTYLDKILGAEKTPKRGAPNARPITNFSLFHEDLMNRMRAISQITNDFEKRTKTIEQRFVIEFSSLNKRMGDKWKEVDKFEIGLKTLAEKHTALRKKLYVKEGELEAAKMTISEQSAQITHLERSGSGGLGKMTAAELKGVSTRVANLERRNTHMQNIVLKKDEQMTAQAEQSRANEEKWASRVKEYERLRQLDLEKLKQEKQGAKEAMSTMQKEIESLREQLTRVVKREDLLSQVLKQNGVNPPAHSDKRPSR